MKHRVKKYLQNSKPFRVWYDFGVYLCRLPRFISEFRRFASLEKPREGVGGVRWRDRVPCLYDSTATTAFDRHYIYQNAWAARILAELRPSLHVDVSSQIQFSTIVSAFIRTEFYDYRPADLRLSNLSSKQGDLMKLPFADGSIPSLSCMHVVEHVGLGRYGDPIDPQGDLKAIAELKRVLAPGGNLLFVVPVGAPRVQFNAHRIYSYVQVVRHFAGLKLVRFALVPDDESEGLVEDASPQLADLQSYGCGCFWFRKE